MKLRCLWSAVWLTGLLLVGCGQNMDDQAKYKTFRPTAEPQPWAHSARQPVAGTIARGGLSEPIPESLPVAVTADLLERGRERYTAYCVPCHSPLGDGQGVVVQRGFPAPPSYHTPRLRAVSDGHIYRVISEGYGVMYSYAARVAPADRWAIVAYIRALQLSQHAPAALLTESGP